MDVDASERRPGGGGRGSHTPQHDCRKRAGAAATDRSPVMEKRSELYVIQEPETPVKCEVLHISGIRSHGPASPRPVGRPWPRHIAWREYLRRAKQKIGV
jgi:hypothetical protein